VLNKTFLLGFPTGCLNIAPSTTDSDRLWWRSPRPQSQPHHYPLIYTTTLPIFLARQPLTSVSSPSVARVSTPFRRAPVFLRRRPSSHHWTLMLVPSRPSSWRGSAWVVPWHPSCRHYRLCRQSMTPPQARAAVRLPLLLAASLRCSCYW
jgi:hypothetical protein